MKVGASSFRFNDVYIESAGTAVGVLESEGPLSTYFDVHYDNQYCGQDSWEKAESELMRSAIETALKKGNLTASKIDVGIGGDLINQLIPTHYTFRQYNIPFFGVYGACSTSMESLILGAIFVESEHANRVMIASSSHNSSAERQFRNPTEYGGPKNETSQFTITGAGAAILSSTLQKIKVESATAGIIVDAMQKNPSDMGSAMAPAAAHTILQHFKDLKVQSTDYDLIVTGDLASIGSPILIDILKKDGLDISAIHQDCGKLIFDESQPVYAGGSGAGCCAVVTFGYILQLLLDGKLKRVLVVATGALLNTMILQQKETIPCIAHAVTLVAVD